MHLDIQQAARLTNKNDTTIRRLIKQPTSKPYVRVTNGKLYIDQSYLFGIYPPVQEASPPVQEPISVHSPTQEPTHSPMQSIDKLLQAKDETIEILRQDVIGKERVIGQLIERAREQNIIIQSLQDKVKLLPEATPEPPSNDYSNFEKLAIGCFVVIVGLLVYYLFTS